MDIPVRRLMAVLALAAAALWALNFIPRRFSGVLRDRFSLLLEGNVPTWFSTVLLFSVGLAAVEIARRHARAAIAGARFWSFFAAAFFFLSLDETSQPHEAVELLSGRKWYVFYVPPAAVFLAACGAHLRADPYDRADRAFVLGGIILFGLGGVGLEAVDHHFRRRGPIDPDLAFWLQSAEEMIEMGGALLVLAGLCRLLNGMGSAGKRVS